MKHTLYIIKKYFGVYVCTDRDEMIGFAAAFGWLDKIDEFHLQVEDAVPHVRFLMNPELHHTI